MTSQEFHVNDITVYHLYFNMTILVTGLLTDYSPNFIMDILFNI